MGQSLQGQQHKSWLSRFSSLFLQDLVIVEQWYQMHLSYFLIWLVARPYIDDA